jgi:hypothetical protein
VNIEIAFVISVWVVAFLICLASGIPLVVTIFVSSAMAYGLRKLWLRCFIFFNEALLTGLIALLVALLIITDRFGFLSFLCESPSPAHHRTDRRVSAGVGKISLSIDGRVAHGGSARSGSSVPYADTAVRRSIGCSARTRLEHDVLSLGLVLCKVYR